MDLRTQVAADLPLAAATPVRSEGGGKTIMEALDALSRGDQQQLQEGGAWGVGGHDGDAPRLGSCSNIGNQH